MAGMMGSAVLAVTALGFVIVPRLSAIDFSLGYLGSLICKAVVLATITIMCAGYMWNGIRNAPYVTTDQAGRTQYFAAGFQNQNGAETQIVAMVCEYASELAYELAWLSGSHFFLSSF